jgi:UDP-2,4-diacetamido-2,4,6-trideoxy-beta-L-altropyranose hydrolase
MNIYSKNIPQPNSMHEISLRDVKHKDCQIVWQWANDPATRKASFSSQTILWEDHVQWFELKLKDSNCLFYIINQNPGMLPVGTIRYDIQEDHAIISINIAPDQRQKYIGSRAIMMSEKEVFQKESVATIHAFIKTDNIRSINMFTKLGYINTGNTLIGGTLAYDYAKKENIK